MHSSVPDTSKQLSFVHRDAIQHPGESFHTREIYLFLTPWGWSVAAVGRGGGGVSVMLCNWASLSASQVGSHSLSQPFDIQAWRYFGIRTEAET